MKANPKNNGKRNKQALPERCKKVDTSVNGDAALLLREHAEAEKKLYPLRIDRRTVIYVTKDKCTPEYAGMKRRQFGLSPVREKKGGNARVHVDVEEVRGLVRTGTHLMVIAKRMGVSRTTIANYIRKYNLRGEDGKKQ